MNIFVDTCGDQLKLATEMKIPIKSKRFFEI